MKDTNTSTNLRQHRILIATSCYNIIDGVTLTVRKIEQQLLDEGHAVCILTTRSGDEIHTNLVPIHPNRMVAFLDNAFPIPGQGDPNNSDISYYLGLSLDAKIKKRIADFGPTLIHVTCPDFTCLHMIEYAREESIPLMGTYHSNIPDYFDHYTGLSFFKIFTRPLFTHMYGFLQTLYVPTPYIQKHVMDSYSYTADNLGIWGRGVDLERFNPSHRSMEWRRSLGIQDHEVVICWVGRLFAEKRPEIFAQVMRRLHKENLPYFALVVGTGPADEELRALPKTKHLGWMSGDALSVAYASSDILLFPSAVETFGNVSLEAAASGLPIIVEKGCSGHVVKDGVTGYACNLGGVDDYHEATRSLVKNTELRASMAKAAREFSLDFENRKVLKQMLDNYTQVTNELQNDYHGQHRERDEAHQGSFIAGTHPRFLFLHLVEFFILILGFIISSMSWLLKVLCFWKVPATTGGAGDETKPLDHNRANPAASTEGGVVAPSLIARPLTMFLSLFDTAIFHAFIRFLVKVALIYAKMESFVRNNVSNRSVSKRKRKDSNYGVDDGPEQQSEDVIREDASIARRVRSASKTS